MQIEQSPDAKTTGRRLPCRLHRVAESTLVAVTALLLTAAAYAAPATFVTALPVSTSQILSRFNWEPTFSNNGLTSVQFPIDLGYGITARWTILATFHEGYAAMDVPSGAGSLEQLHSAGMGDTLVFLRYTLIKHDKMHSTLRVTPLAGAVIPSGDSQLQSPNGLLPQPLQTGGGTWSPYVGLAMGSYRYGNGFSGDITYRYNPVKSSGITPGDQVRADWQEQWRFYPLHLQDGFPHFALLSLEENYVHNGQSHSLGLPVPQSVGFFYTQDLVAEYQSMNYLIGFGVRRPAVQDYTSPTAVRQRGGLLLVFEYNFSRH
ncbi:MAG: hypothetical protein ACLGQX_06375 [Acidobacteriota bacterium]